MIKLTFIGDIFPGDELFTSGFGIKSKTVETNRRRWENNIKETVGKANYIIGNLESPLVDDADATSKTFYGIPMFADILKDGGVNVLNLANNHIAEHGAEGFAKTVDALHGRGIMTVGGLKECEPEIITLEEEQTTICMAGFCDERVCAIANPGCYASLDDEKVFKTLERMKKMHPDVIIFIFHWGNEYIHFPSLEQRTLAYKLIDNGANLIIGHHPHVIQPYENYHGGHIIYSLGNFCFDDVQSDHFGKGMTAQITIQQKTIHHISYEGILVQDMAFGNNLVKKMNHQSFERYVGKINSKYQALKALPDEEYEAAYQKTFRQAHTRERILMRVNILKKVLDIRHRHRMQLLRNIKNYLTKK